MITEMFGLQMLNDMSTRIGVNTAKFISFVVIKKLKKISLIHAIIIAGIDLIAEIPPKECTERVVWCDGGDPNLGHPKVYINLVSKSIRDLVDRCM